MNLSQIINAFLEKKQKLAKPAPLIED